MEIPKYDELYRPVLNVLADGQLHKLNELRTKIASNLHLSEDAQRTMLSSGTMPVFNNRVNWACTYLKQAKLIEAVSRGVYHITEAGTDVLKENPAVLDNKYLNRFESFRQFISRSETPSSARQAPAAPDENGLSPQDLMEDAYRKIYNTLADEVLSEVMKQSPVFFEHLVVRLLTQMGYGSSLDDGIVTKVSGDEGIDGIIREDKLGFSKIYIQAKRWDMDAVVGRPEIQRFAGALLGKGASKGLFITTARFSGAAKDYASDQQIVLVDGTDLAKLMIDYNVGVSAENTYIIKKIDSDFFDDSFA